MRRILTGVSLGGCVLWLALCVLGVIEILVDPIGRQANLAGVARTRTELAAAKSRWAAQNVKTYGYQVQGAVPLSCFVDGWPLTFDGTEPWNPTHWGGGKNPYCASAGFAVPHMFERVEHDLANIDPSQDVLTVEFDPVYGYVTRYVYDSGGCCGLLKPVVTDGYIWFAFSQFQVMEKK